MLRKNLYAIILIVIGTTAQAQKILGKLSFEQGDTIAITMQLKNSITQDAGGQTLDFTIDGTAAHYYKVTNSTADNSTLRHGVKQITYKFDGMGQKMSFNSDNPRDLKGMMGKPVQEMLGKTYDMIIDPTGMPLLIKPEKIEAPQVEERMMIIANMLKDLTAVVYPPEKNTVSFFSVLPPREVGIGDTWEASTTSAGEKATTVYTLTAITDSTVIVDVKTKGQFSSKSTIMGVEAMTSMSSTTDGKITLNKATGLIKEKTSTIESRGTVDVMGMSMPVTSKGTINIQVSTKR